MTIYFLERIFKVSGYIGIVSSINSNLFFYSGLCVHLTLDVNPD